MLRFVLVIIACVSLSSCWVSDERFFATGDWAQLGIAGEYDVAGITDNENPPRHATLSTRPDGLVEIVMHTPDEGDETSLLGLVPIAGGSGDFFLAVDRTSPGDGDIYFIARASDRELAFYFPDCAGTPAMAGMVADSGGPSDTATCTFSSEDALMEAALTAERFLSARQIVTVPPFLAFSRSDSDEPD